MGFDNPAWYALRGPQATVAEGGPLAVRFRPDVAVFAVLPDEATLGARTCGATLVGPDGVAVLVRDSLTAPAGWERLVSMPTVQMTGAAVAGATCGDIVDLTADDVAEMLALVERTKPGPFKDRTIELGSYIGARDNVVAPVAMAGERIFSGSYREISAVCTDVEHRGKGLAGRLVRHLCVHPPTR